VSSSYQTVENLLISSSASSSSATSSGKEEVDKTPPTKPRRGSFLSRTVSKLFKSKDSEENKRRRRSRSFSEEDLPSSLPPLEALVNLENPWGFNLKEVDQRHAIVRGSGGRVDDEPATFVCGFGNLVRQLPQAVELSWKITQESAKQDDQQIRKILKRGDSLSSLSIVEIKTVVKGRERVLNDFGSYGITEAHLRKMPPHPHGGWTDFHSWVKKSLLPRDMSLEEREERLNLFQDEHGLPPIKLGSSKGTKEKEKPEDDLSEPEKEKPEPDEKEKLAR